MDVVIDFFSRIFASGTLLEQIATGSIVALATFLLAVVGRWLVKAINAPAQRQQRRQKWFDWFDTVVADFERLVTFMDGHVRLLEGHTVDANQPRHLTAEWASAHAEMKTAGPFWSRGSFVSEPKDLDVVFERATTAKNNWKWMVSCFEKRRRTASIQAAARKYFAIPLSLVLTELHTKVAAIDHPRLSSANDKLASLARTSADLENRARERLLVR